MKKAKSNTTTTNNTNNSNYKDPTIKTLDEFDSRLDELYLKLENLKKLDVDDQPKQRGNQNKIFEKPNPFTFSTKNLSNKKEGDFISKNTSIITHIATASYSDNNTFNNNNADISIDKEKCLIAIVYKINKKTENSFKNFDPFNNQDDCFLLVEKTDKKKRVIYSYTLIKKDPKMEIMLKKIVVEKINNIFYICINKDTAATSKLDNSIPVIEENEVYKKIKNSLFNKEEIACNFFFTEQEKALKIYYKIIDNFNHSPTPKSSQSQKSSKITWDFQIFKSFLSASFIEQNLPSKTWINQILKSAEIAAKNNNFQLKK